MNSNLIQVKSFPTYYNNLNNKEKNRKKNKLNLLLTMVTEARATVMKVYFQSNIYRKCFLSNTDYSNSIFSITELVS